MRRATSRSYDGAGRRHFMRGDHAELAETWQAHTCRVCVQPIAIGVKAWKRAWSVERAHEACGWLRHSEYLPHEATGAELRTRLWQWACPDCRRDVVRRAPPGPYDDHRCSACRDAIAAIVAAGRLHACAISHGDCHLCGKPYGAHNAAREFGNTCRACAGGLSTAGT